MLKIRDYLTTEGQTTNEIIFTLAIIIGCGLSALAADDEPEAAGEDSSAGLPDQYAKKLSDSGQHDFAGQEFAVIYPTLEAEEAAEDANHPERIKDYVVALQPFTVLGELQTKYPYFQNQNHGGSVRNGRTTARSPDYAPW